MEPISLSSSISDKAETDHWQFRIRHKYGSVLQGDCRFGLYGPRCQLKSGSLLLKARTWTPVQKPRDVRFPLSLPMTERQWELYRLNVVEEWQESPHKAAVVGAIKHKLMILALQEKASIEAPDALASTEKQRKATP